jgi:CBS domain containing-hemolysin-like protein
MTGLRITLLLGLTVVSLGLACVEAAFYLVKRRRLGRLAAHNPLAGAALSYLDDPPALLMPVHIGTYTAHMAMTLLLVSLFFDITLWSLLLAFLVMMAYLFLFRLTVPYALVRRSPERSLVMLMPAFDLYARACCGGGPRRKWRTRWPRRSSPRCPCRPSTTPTRRAPSTRWPASRRPWPRTS